MCPYPKTGEDCGLGHSGKEKEIKPYEAKELEDKARSRTTVNLSLASSHLRVLKESLGMTSDAKLVCFLLDG